MATETEGQHHPLSVYFWVWFGLFLLSTGSYLVDIIEMPTMLSWVLITLFMLAKAGLIMAIFMHMQWERWSMNMVILTPPGVILVALLILALEAEYTLSSRLKYFFLG